MSEEKAKVLPVMVALRCRPLIDREEREGCKMCIRTVPGESQVILGKDRAFTYDYAFGPTTPQADVYEEACSKLIKSIFKGYNATILAYGQTGSGKTFTMGGCYEDSLAGLEDNMGVIPRVLRDVYSEMEEKADYEYTIHLSYIEIYNEDVNDLLSSRLPREPLAIREETNGSIKIVGVREVEVKDYDSTIKLLTEGSRSRSTGATAMNNTSSRSHAICTLSIEQTNKKDMNDCCKMKFHLVDLAGSERCKRTQAEGERLREGININKGLLVLGNVISALGEEGSKPKHIPYRDSKLTRLLQDSLGGNSHTLMIACVSPADSNIEETLNTLRYADRARKIKNKPIINRDPQAAEIMRLKALVQQYQMQSLQSGLKLVDGSCSTLSMDSSPEEIKKLQERISQLEAENFQLTKELQHSVNQSRQILAQSMKLEASNERLGLKLGQFKDLQGIDVGVLSCSLDPEKNPEAKAELEKLHRLSQVINTEEEAEGEGEDAEAHHESMEEEEAEENDENMGTPDQQAAQQEHTLRQAKLHQELTHINNLLNTKQALADRLQGSDRELNDMKEKYEEVLKEWKAKTQQLEKDKELLTHTLHDAQANAKASKVSEQRRQRLKELEQQMSSLKKKMAEQNRVVKLKESSDKQVSKLSMEIQSLKQHRVKLMKQMKEESIGFQKWKREKNQEVMQLQKKNSKSEFEMQRIKKQFEKQLAVQKRKTTEAVAANKRLMEALDKKKQVESEKVGKLEKYDSTSIGNRVRNWLSYELEVKVSIREAKYHLSELMNNRKVLTEKYQQLKDSLEEGPLSEKFSWLGENTDDADASVEATEIRKQMDSIQLEIELINVQIEEIQQKIVEADQESKGKSTWQSLHTMNEAKCALKFLLDQAVNARTDNLKTSGTLREMETQGAEEERQVKELRAEVSRMKAQHRRELARREAQYEEKVLALLAAEPNRPVTGKALDAQAKEKMKLMESKLARLEGVETALNEKETECTQLKQNMTTLMLLSKKVKLLPDLESPSSPFLDLKPKMDDDSSTTLNSTFVASEEPEEPPAKRKTRSNDKMKGFPESIPMATTSGGTEKNEDEGTGTTTRARRNRAARKKTFVKKFSDLSSNMENSNSAFEMEMDTKDSTFVEPIPVSTTSGGIDDDMLGSNDTRAARKTFFKESSDLSNSMDTSENTDGKDVSKADTSTERRKRRKRTLTPMDMISSGFFDNLKYDDEQL